MCIICFSIHIFFKIICSSTNILPPTASACCSHVVQWLITHTHTHACAHTHTHTHTHTESHTCMYAHIHMHAHAHTHTYTHTEFHCHTFNSSWNWVSHITEVEDFEVQGGNHYLIYIYIHSHLLVNYGTKLVSGLTKSVKSKLLSDQNLNSDSLFMLHFTQCLQQAWTSLLQRHVRAKHTVHMDQNSDSLLMFHFTLCLQQTWRWTSLLWSHVRANQAIRMDQIFCVNNIKYNFKNKDKCFSDSYKEYI